MQTFYTLLLILSPLFVGFALPVSKKLFQLSELGLRWIVFVILTYLGIELSHIQGLIGQLTEIISLVGLLAFLTIGSGFLSLLILDKVSPFHYEKSQDDKQADVSIIGSVLQISCVFIGFAIGKVVPEQYIALLPDSTITVLLMVLILLVGISLKGAGISLKEVLFNRRGVLMSIIFTISVLTSGVVFSLLTDGVSVFQGLALSSGFGWYSLSAVIMTDAYDAIWGSVALFNDLFRELFALIFIPFVMKKYPSTAIGLGGVTSLDFTLPVIQQSGGIQVVPLTISFSFIMNILSPILMVFFASFG